MRLLCASSRRNAPLRASYGVLAGAGLPRRGPPWLLCRPVVSLSVHLVKGEIMAFFPQWVGVARRGPQAASPAALAEHCFAPAVLKHVGPLTEVRAMSAA